MQLVKDDAAMESIIAKVMELQNKENTNIPLYEKQRSEEHTSELQSHA